MQTKFDIGQEVFCMISNKVCSGKIKKIILEKHEFDNDPILITYFVFINGWNKRRYESEIFLTKEELIKRRVTGTVG